jgi:ABC-2 type transport system ATP-binding protein
MTILELAHIRKTYGSHAAVDDLSLSVQRGEVLALLGPNGAGKTTTLDIALGLRHANSGEVGMHAASIGVTPQETGMPETLRVCEIVDFVGDQYTGRATTKSILENFGMADLAKRQAGGLSGGQMRRLALALAFVGEPELVVLDEPTTSLDVEARRSVWAYVQEYARSGGTVLLTTHHMEEAEALASRIAVMSAGRIVREGTPAQIRSTLTARHIAYTGDPFDPATFGIDAVVESDGSRVRITATDTDDVLRVMVRNDIVFSDLSVSDGSLEDAVLSLTGMGAGQ